MHFIGTLKHQTKWVITTTTTKKTALAWSRVAFSSWKRKQIRNTCFFYFFSRVVVFSLYPFRCVWILARLPFFLDPVITYVAKRRYHFYTLLWWKITKSSTKEKISAQKQRKRVRGRKRHHPENFIFIELREWCCSNERSGEKKNDKRSETRKTTATKIDRANDNLYIEW